MRQRRKWKSFFAITTIFFFFCTFILGCAGEYRQVRRDEGRVTEYYVTSSGKQVDTRVVEEALRAGDIKTLAEVSSIYRPISKEQVSPEEYSSGEISLDQDYPGGTKYINVGANPQKMLIPPGWWPIGLPKDINATVKSGKNGKKQATGVLRKGEVIWVYVVIKDDKPLIDPKKGILLQVGAVKRCGNAVVSDIKMWYPLPLLRQAAQKQVEILVLQKVIDRGQAVIYMEREDSSKYWLIGLVAVAAIGGFFIGMNQSKTETQYVEKCTNCPPPKPPPPKPPPPPPPPPISCPPGPGPAPRPAP